MLTDNNIKTPKVYDQIIKAGAKLGFTMPSDLKTGSLLRTLSASKPAGRFLDIGTGTGLSLSWLAEGADQDSTILSIDINDEFQQVAITLLGSDSRISMLNVDGNKWLDSYVGPPFDLIFADAMPGKFENLDTALTLLNIGGFYVIDDLLPQSNWPDGHQERVDSLLKILNEKDCLVHTSLEWSTGLMVFTRIK